MDGDDFAAAELAEARARLRETVDPAPMLAHLRDGLAGLDAELASTVLARIPAFRESGNPDVLRQLAEHGPRHGREVLRLLDGGAIGSFDFVREHARLRAEQRFPLDASLHAYRCGHKLTIRWLTAALRTQVPDAPAEAAVALADFALAYTDAISTIASQAYAERLRLISEAAVDRRTMLMGLLLEGYDESDPRFGRLLRSAGLLDDRLAYCVVVARPVDPAEMTSPERARRLADTLESLVPAADARVLTDVRDDVVVAVTYAARRVSGFSRPASPLAPRLTAMLASAGPSVLIGVSSDVPASARIPLAYRQARLALELARVDRRVVAVGELPLQTLAVHLAGDGLRDLMPIWSGRLRQADTDAQGALSQTLTTYADADMNVVKAAARLGIHANTLYARLARVRELTGRDPRRYRALAELLLVIDVG